MDKHSTRPNSITELSLQVVEDQAKGGWDRGGRLRMTAVGGRELCEEGAGRQQGAMRRRR